jgi:hypothetical protein
MISTHQVIWTINGVKHVNDVILEEGYTTEDDIPTILAIGHLGGDANRAKEIEVLKVRALPTS